MDKKFNGTTVETNGVRSIAGGGTGAATAEQARINLGAAASSHPHSNATATTDGFMSAVDKTKLDAATTFYQLGADIDGEAASDTSGNSVSINAAGDIVAIGATGNDGNGSNSGHVRVYKFVSGSWVQLGADIDGEAAGDRSGTSVSINAAGDIVAISALYNNGDNFSSTQGGHARVYKFISGSWVKQGLDIDGEVSLDQSGNSVSINAAGDIVAIGATLNDSNGSNSGHVRVYKFNGISNPWIQQGLDIDGEAANDRSGTSVSMNAAGDVVAIGSYNNSGNGQNSGHVRVYKFNGISNPWIQQGLDIDGEAANDRSGESVSINAAGDIVAIGAPSNSGNGQNSGHVRVYKFINGLWVKQGADIDGEAASDSSGFSVSLNAVGDIVAIGAIDNDGNGSNSGHVRVYKFISGSWVKQGLDIDGEAANDRSSWKVSINAAGDIVAIGATGNDGNGSDSGHVRVHTNNLTYIAESYKASLKHTHLLSEITQSGATTNQVATWNGTAWVPQTPASGGGGVTAHKSSHATGGDDALSPADIGAAASSHTHPLSQLEQSAATDGQVPVWDATTSAWVPQNRSPQIDRRSITGSTTWAKPVGAKQFVIECVAGGGGGGRGIVTASGQSVSGGGGGGSGGYTRVVINADDLPDTDVYTVTVGSGGSGGTTGNAVTGSASNVRGSTLGIFVNAAGGGLGGVGAAAGASSAGSAGAPAGNTGGAGNITAAGGNGTGQNYSASSGGAGGGCGTPSGGSFQPFNGGVGGSSHFISGGSATWGALSSAGNGGNGGTAPTRAIPSLVINGGGGGGGGASTSAGATGGNGGNATGVGGGGGGGGSVAASSGTGGNGGNGAPGIVVITTYF